MNDVTRDMIHEEMRSRGAAAWLPWILAALAVVGAIVTVTLHTSQFQTRAQVERIVERQAPYVADRSSIMRVVNGYDQTVEAIRRDVSAINESLAAIRESLKRAEHGRRKGNR